MSTTFNLTNTATEVNTAIQAVVGADTAPDGASANMVTSQGVYNHIQTELGPFKSKTVTTESTGISNTDNDTSVPTSAAVKDFVDAAVSGVTPNNRLRIKVLPGDFVPNSNPTVTLTSGGSFDGTGYATYDIPHGYKATEMQIYATAGSGNNTGIRVSEANIDTSSVTEKGTSSTSGNRVLDITDVVGSDTNYLIVYCSCNGGVFLGGYFTIAPV